MEQEPDKEEQAETDVTIGELVEACRGVLPDEELADLGAMEEPEEAYLYLLSYLPEFGVEDPDSFLGEKGLVLGSRYFTDEELAAHHGDYSADEVDSQ